MNRDIRKNLKMGHSLLCPILFILLSFTLIYCPDQGICDLADDYIRQGMEQMRNRRYREAIVYFEAARSSAPEDESIRTNLSFAYHNLASEYASEKDWHRAIQNEKLALKNDLRNGTIKEQLSIYYNNYGLEYADKERYDLAKDNIREALRYKPDSDLMKANLYSIILKEADYYRENNNHYKAASLGQEAVSLAPDKATAFIFLGNIYYQQDNFKDALICWNDALKIDPENKELKARIEKSKREKKVEEAFKTRKREHFKIRFERETDSEYVWAISDILRDGRKKLRGEFNLYCDEVVPVIVYSGEKFLQAMPTQQWALGIYDGKIRIKKQDIAGGDDSLRRVLYHEYAHAALYLTYGGNIPAWLHEGFAQFNEPRQLLSISDKEFLRSYIEKHGDFSIEGMHSMFGQKDETDTLRAAYLEARIFISYLIEKYKKYKIKRLFEELKEARPWQEALREVYGKNIDRLDKEFNKYLRNILVS